MALAEKHLAAEFNRPGHDIVDHRTYVFLGDGCLMEGISHEACSFAGTHKLGKLVAFYDDNGISIDGETRGWFTDDTPKRFTAYGWHVVPNVDGHDADAVRRAIDAARAEKERPSLICCETIIGYGAPNVQGTSATHGAALGPTEAAAARKNLGWDEPPFVIPADVKATWDARLRARVEDEWRARFAAYRKQHPELAAELERRMNGGLPAKWSEHAAKAIETLAASGERSRRAKASQPALEAFAPALPGLVGGSADLTGSNNTQHKYSKPLTPNDASGNYLHYGVREFGMAAMMNGQAAHGGIIPYGGTFLVFSDYARNALRMSALIGLRSIFVLTHDSIGLGEDGPTHQPIEHLASLRLMPNMDLWRPCDTVETAVAWRPRSSDRTARRASMLTRQDLPQVPRTPEQIAMIARGAYIVSSGNDAPAITLIATGSEVQLVVGAARELEVRR